jgi:hypothetical protein
MGLAKRVLGFRVHKRIQGLGLQTLRQLRDRRRSSRGTPWAQSIQTLVYLSSPFSGPSVCALPGCGGKDPLTFLLTFFFPSPKRKEIGWSVSDFLVNSRHSSKLSPREHTIRAFIVPCMA